MTTANLKYLTTEQALEDLAALIKHVNAKFGLQKPRWIALGGSYPGEHVNKNENKTVLVTCLMSTLTNTLLQTFRHDGRPVPGLASRADGRQHRLLRPALPQG